MTRDETNAIRSLSEKLDNYHVSVEKHITACEKCRETVEALKTEMWGKPAEGVQHPGVKDRVKSLETSRNTLRKGLQAAWGVLLILVPAVIAAVWQFAKKIIGQL